MSQRDVTEPDPGDELWLQVPQKREHAPKQSGIQRTLTKKLVSPTTFIHYIKARSWLQKDGEGTTTTTRNGNKKKKKKKKKFSEVLCLRQIT
jgi:hypothetical protein